MPLIECLKCPFLEHPSAVNVVTDSKHYANLHGSTFIMLLQHFEIDWVGKRLNLSGLKSYYCFLTY